MGQQGNKIETRIRETIEEVESRLIELSHKIASEPELAFNERRAASRVGKVLTDAGFSVEHGKFGLDTAVEATFGSGDLTVAIVGEYDALPHIGHACGHNTIAAAGVGAAIALAAVADDLNLSVRFLGTPAEEAGGGKILMLDAGAWDDVDLSLMIHPGPSGQPKASGFQTFALALHSVVFRGNAAHAAASPHKGVNAADAVTLTQVAVGLMRQQLPKSVVIASKVVEAGQATNIIPDFAAMEFEVRAVDLDEWEQTQERLRKIIAGAALATGCSSEVTPLELPYESLVSDPDLAQEWDEVFSEVLGYEVTSYSSDFVGASTDMGNVSRFVPSIHPMIGITQEDVFPHNREFSEAAISEAGDKIVVDGALGMAITVARVASKPDLVERLRKATAVRKPYSLNPKGSRDSLQDQSP